MSSGRVTPHLVTSLGFFGFNPFGLPGFFRLLQLFTDSGCLTKFSELLKGNVYFRQCKCIGTVNGYKGMLLTLIRSFHGCKKDWSNKDCDGDERV